MSDLKERSFASKFLQYVTLSMLSMAGTSFYILADTFFIAQGMGTNGIAALNLLIPAFSLMNAMGLMFGMGAATRYKIRLAEGKRKEADRTFTEAFILAALFSLVFVVLGLCIPEHISHLLGGDAQTSPLMVDYLQIIWVFAPLFMLNNLLVAIVRNDNRPGLAMGVMLTGSIINVILDWVFIFPMGLGMYGAALATGIAPTVSLVILFAARVLKKNTYRFVRPRFRLRDQIGVVTLGISTFVNEISNGIVIIVFNFILLGLIGNTGVAAYSVITNVALVVIAMITGIAQGAQPLMSAGHGAGDKKYCKKTYYSALIFGIVFAVSAYGILAGFSDQIIQLFNSENNIELAQIAKKGIYIYFIGIFPAAFTIISAMYFNSVERSARAIALSLSRGLVLLIPSAILLSALFGITGVWSAAPVTEILTAMVALVLIIIFNRKKAATKSVVPLLPSMRFTIVTEGLQGLPDARKIRETVFQDEQGTSNEFDELDGKALHALVKKGEKAVATGRLYEDGDVWRIGRVAVLEEYRKQGFGKEVLRTLEREAETRGAVAVKVFAITDCVGFYKKMGYREELSGKTESFPNAVQMVKRF